VHSFVQAIAQIQLRCGNAAARQQRFANRNASLRDLNSRWKAAVHRLNVLKVRRLRQKRRQTEEE
jgi:hypothetical protein